MVKFPFPTSSLKCAMSFVAFPGGMLGACSRLRPLSISLIGWCASCNTSNNNNNNNSKLWDFNIQCDKGLEGRMPDIMIVVKQKRICKIIDVAVPNDSRVNAKEQEKIEKYQELRWEFPRLWKMKVEVTPVVVGALGTITN